MDIGSIVSDTFQQYQIFMAQNPEIGKPLTTIATYVASDLAVQLMGGGKVNKKRLGFTAFMATTYNYCIDGLIESGNLIEKYISDNSVVKSILGPNALGVPFAMYFFINNAIGERYGYGKKAIKELVKTYGSLLSKKDKTKNYVSNVYSNVKNVLNNNISMKEFLIGGAVGAPVFITFHAVNYEYVPDELKMPLALGVGFVYTTFVTALALASAKRKKNADTFSNNIPL